MEKWLEEDKEKDSLKEKNIGAERKKVEEKEGEYKVEEESEQVGERRLKIEDLEEKEQFQ